MLKWIFSVRLFISFAYTFLLTGYAGAIIPHRFWNNFGYHWTKRAYSYVIIFDRNSKFFNYILRNSVIFCQF